MCASSEEHEGKTFQEKSTYVGLLGIFFSLSSGIKKDFPKIRCYEGFETCRKRACSSLVEVKLLKTLYIYGCTIYRHTWIALANIMYT